MSDTFQMLSSDLPNANYTSVDKQRDTDLFGQMDSSFESMTSKQKSPTLVLSGPNGSGKSTIALAYARFKLASNEKLVARCVHSDTFENLYMNYIQKLLNIFFSDNLRNFLKYKNKQTIVKTLNDKLKSLDNEFLFVFVNLKPEKNKLNELFELIRSNMPSNVKMLITTRNKIEQLDFIELKLLNRVQADTFVDTYLSEQKNQINFGENNIYSGKEESTEGEEEEVETRKLNLFLPLNLLKMVAYVKHFRLKIGLTQLEVAGGPIRRILDDLFVNFEHDKSLISYIAYLDARLIRTDLIQSLANLSDNLLSDSFARLNATHLLVGEETDEYDTTTNTSNITAFRVHADLHASIRQFVDERLDVDEKQRVYTSLIDKFYGEIQMDLALDTVYDSKTIDKLRHIKRFLKIFKDFEKKSDQVRHKEAQIHAYLAQLYENIFINHEYALKYYMKAVENFKKVAF